MNRSIFAVFALFAITAHAAVPETPHLDFVSELIYELGATENIHAAAERESKESNKNPTLLLTSGIHYSTQINLELRARISKLGSMHLNPPYETLIESIMAFYKQKVELHEMLIDIATKFLSAQRPDVDYGKLSAQMPQIRAMLEDIDASILKLTPMVFFTLLDEKPDPNGKLTFLSITKKQRQQLLTELSNQFGSKLNAKNQTPIVSAAAVLREGLLMKKCSDER